jgi:hypothetical protein
MLQPGGDADFALEPLDPDRRAQHVVQHLERYSPSVAEIVGEKDRGRSAAAEQRLDRVTLAERGGEEVDRGIGYCRAASAARGMLRYFASHACTSA